MDSHRSETALNAVKESIKHFPDNPKLYIYLARASEELYDWNTATEATRKALEYCPDAIGYKVNLALYLENIESKDSELIWKEVANYDSNNPICRFIDLTLKENTNNIRYKWTEFIRNNFDHFFPIQKWQPENTQQCKLCKSNNYRSVFKKHPCDWPVLICRSCGLVQVSPEPSPDELVEIYGEDYMELYREKAGAYIPPDRNQKPTFLILSKLFNWLESNDFKEFEDSLQGKGKMLDVGCGCGLTMRDFYLRGWDVEGIEVSKPAVDFLKSHGMKAECTTLEQYNPSDETYDLVTMNHVIEHVPDPMKLLKQIGKCLKPGGRLINITPNWLSLPGILTGPEWFNDQEHVTYFSVEDLIRMTEEAGFEVIAWKTRIGIESETPRQGWDKYELSSLFKDKIENTGLADVVEIYSKKL